MRMMDAFEQAYKNGYAAGIRAAEEKIVYCKDCVSHGNCLTEDTFRITRIVNPYCCGGKRRSDG